MTFNRLLPLLLFLLLLVQVGMAQDRSLPTSVYRLTGENIEVSAGSEQLWTVLNTITGVRLFGWNAKTPTRLVAVTHRNLLEFSGDGGNHWEVCLLFSPTFHPERIIIDDNNPNLVFLEGTDDALNGSAGSQRWRSLNGGRDWIESIGKP